MYLKLPRRTYEKMQPLNALKGFVVPRIAPPEARTKNKTIYCFENSPGPGGDGLVGGGGRGTTTKVGLGMVSGQSPDQFSLLFLMKLHKESAPESLGASLIYFLTFPY